MPCPIASLAPCRHHPHIMLQLRHVFFRRRFFRERPRQHELGLKDSIAALNPAIQSRRHPAQRRMAHSLLDVGDDLPGTGFIPAAIKLFSRDPKLHDEIAGQIFRLDFPPLLAPQPDQRFLITAHDDPGIRAANK